MDFTGHAKVRWTALGRAFRQSNMLKQQESQHLMFTTFKLRFTTQPGPTGGQIYYAEERTPRFWYLKPLFYVCAQELVSGVFDGLSLTIFFIPPGGWRL